ncbi:hypothetical protein Ntsu_48690 [Nocardia sp. IFM 10818]
MMPYLIRGWSAPMGMTVNQQAAVAVPTFFSVTSFIGAYAVHAIGLSKERGCDYRPACMAEVDAIRAFILPLVISGVLWAVLAVILTMILTSPSQYRQERESTDEEWPG